MADRKHSSDQTDFHFPDIQEGNKTVNLKKYVTEKNVVQNKFLDFSSKGNDPWIYPNSKDSKSCLDTIIL